MYFFFNKIAVGRICGQVHLSFAAAAPPLPGNLKLMRKLSGAFKVKCEQLLCGSNLSLFQGKKYTQCSCRENGTLTHS